MVIVLGALLPSAAAATDRSGDSKSTDASTWSLPKDVTGDADASVERDRLRGALASLAAFDGGLLWDPSTQTVTVQMTSDEALQKARGLVAVAGTSLRVTFARVRYSAAELDGLAAQLLDNQAAWAGASGIGGGFDPRSNRVLLQVDPKYQDADRLIAAIKGLHDPRVELQLIDALPGDGAENRVDDFTPWSAGAAIDGANYSCTLGWAWKLWSNSAIVGSTARHCADLTWTNSGTYVGTVFQSKQTVDSALMQGSTYSASVFVGDQTTNDIRPVVGIDTSWSVGDAVAMSGRSSGLNVTNVKLPTYTLPSCAGAGAGLTGVLMQAHVTAGGDSGGPWLTTQSGTGNVIAHGQHYGFGCAAGYDGSFFIKLTAISAAQQASILLQ